MLVPLFRKNQLPTCRDVRQTFHNPEAKFWTSRLMDVRGNYTCNHNWAHNPILIVGVAYPGPVRETIGKAIRPARSSS